MNAWPLSFSPNDELELFSFLLQAFYIPIQQNGSSTGIEKTLSLSVSFFYLTHRHTHIIFFVNAQVYQWASLYSLQCLTDPAHRGRVLLRKTRWKLVCSILQNILLLVLCHWKVWETTCRNSWLCHNHVDYYLLSFLVTCPLQDLTVAQEQNQNDVERCHLLSLIYHTVSSAVTSPFIDATESRTLSLFVFQLP